MAKRNLANLRPHVAPDYRPPSWRAPATRQEAPDVKRSTEDTITDFIVLGLGFAIIAYIWWLIFS